MVNCALENWISVNCKERLEKLLSKNRDVFRISLGSDPPEKVPTMLVKPIPKAHPYRSPQRRYANNQRESLTKTVQELEKMGDIYNSPSSRWAGPALEVTKPGTDRLRFTVDLRGPNAKCEPFQSAMPHLQSKLQECEGSACFAKIDFCHGYWQVELDPKCQEMF